MADTSTTVRCLALLAWLAMAPVLHAAAAEPAVDEEGDDVSPMLQSIDDRQKAVSDSIRMLSINMDRMLGGTEVFPDEAYDSVLSLRFIQRLDEDGGGEFDFNVGGKLSLPGAERRLSLVFLSDDFDDPLDRERGTQRDIDQQTRRSLALRFMEPRHPWGRSATIGLRSGDPIDLLTRLRLWRDIDIGRYWLRPGQSLFWYDERGLGATTDLRVQRPLASTRMLIRSDSIVTWFKRDEQLYYDQILSLLQPLSRRRNLLWQVGMQGESEPNDHVIRYYAQVRFRSVVHRDWLIVEMRPQAMRERENDFRTTLHLYFGFELLFGDPQQY